MANIYLATHREPDYDQINNIIVVSENEDDSVKLFLIELGNYYSPEAFNENFSVEFLGVSHKPAGTLILVDY